MIDPLVILGAGSAFFSDLPVPEVLGLHLQIRVRKPGRHICAELVWTNFKNKTPGFVLMLNASAQYLSVKLFGT